MGLLPSPLAPELPECGLLFTPISFVPPIPISSLGHLTSDWMNHGTMGTLVYRNAFWDYICFVIRWVNFHKKKNQQTMAPLMCSQLYSSECVSSKAWLVQGLILTICKKFKQFNNSQPSDQIFKKADDLDKHFPRISICVAVQKGT